MNSRWRAGLLCATLVLIGCTTVPPSGGPAPPGQLIDVLAVAPASEYHLLGTSFVAPIASITASSTRNSFFPVSNVIDGRPTTAWAPASTDVAPRLTFHLAESMALSTLSIKLSLGRLSWSGNRRVLVDVWLSNNGGATWFPVATDLNPPETVVQSYTTTPTMANAARLDFRATGTNHIANLLVCSAQFIDPTSTLPSTTPSSAANPSLSPSPSPSWAPPSTTPPSTIPPSNTPPSTVPSVGFPTVGCGIFRTLSQGGWGQDFGGSGAPAQFRDTNWSQLADGGQVVVGIGRSLTFTSAAAIADYMTEGGTAGPLNASYINPLGATGGGGLSSQLVALKLNMRGSLITRPVGSGTIEGVVIANGPFTGLSIGAYFNLAQRALGADASVLTSTHTLSAFQAQAADINLFFHDPGNAPDGRDYECGSP